MPFVRPALSELRDDIRAEIDSRLPGADSRPRRAVLNVVATAQAGALYGLYFFLDWISRQITAQTAEEEQLDRHASFWGIARERATTATGNVTLSGTEGSAVAAGTVLRRSDGAEFRILAGVVIAAGTATAEVAATTPGGAANTDAGVKLSFVSPVPGVGSAATVAAGGLAGGSDEEEDRLVLQRILARVQQPPHGGNQKDYVDWALDRGNHGVAVTRAWVYPREQGDGTVTVRFLMDDTYDDGIPEAADVAAVQAYIDQPDVRPVSVEVIVVAPVAVPLDIEVAEIDPDTAEIRAAVLAELEDMLRVRAEPGGTVRLSWIWEAVARATGEDSHLVVSPAADVTHATGEVAVLGEVTWS
ncbi:MAG: baseplate J/gp47 family protein [Tistlia sp.]|uniref:baseplate J/gp47 family protein n=1 Tax=Tistlia sp. TaxID=3057121 RepID=UPI0034A1E244